jgi:hypothetical protein
MSAEKIAFILGRGDLAYSAIRECSAKGYEIYIVALTDNCESDELAKVTSKTKKVIWAKLEKAGTILNFLKDNEINKAVMIGGVHRPNILQLRPDFTALKIILGNLTKIFRGDDAALNVLKQQIKKRSNCQLVGLHEIWPEICAPQDIHIGKSLSESQISLVKKGWLAAKQHGLEDKGQSICIYPNCDIAKETQKGTDALILAAQQPAGILVKTSKPQQDLSLDMPTIGIHTIKNLAKMNFCALVIESNKTIIHEQPEVFKLCEKYNITLISLSDEQARAL